MIEHALETLRSAAEHGYPWSIYPAEATALVAEVERLRKTVADLEDLTDRGYEDERAAVVAYLRDCANAPHPTERGVPSLSPAGRGLLLLHADRIERGEHCSEEDK